MHTLKRRVALVTGAAHPQGMGYATCRKFAEAGASLVVTDRADDASALSELEARARELRDAGAEAMAVALDVTDKAQIEACIARIMDTYGRIDILFNNAGTPVGAGDFLDITDRQWDLSYRINLKGVADLSQAVIPLMIAQGGGSIINNASTAGLGATPQMAPYIATKFALVGLTKALATEFGEQKIRVNAVCPGMVWTQMAQTEIANEQRPGESQEETRARLVDSGLVPLARWAQAEEIADAVVYLASDQASYITGVALPVAGGLAPGL